MMNIVLTLVFSIVMLFFMVFPAMKISEFLVKKSIIQSSKQNIFVVIIDIILALFIGIFLKYY